MTNNEKQQIQMASIALVPVVILGAMWLMASAEMIL